MPHTIVTAIAPALSTFPKYTSFMLSGLVVSAAKAFAVTLPSPSISADEASSHFCTSAATLLKTKRI